MLYLLLQIKSIEHRLRRDSTPAGCRMRWTPDTPHALRHVCPRLARGGGRLFPGGDAVMKLNARAFAYTVYQAGVSQHSTRSCVCVMCMRCVPKTHRRHAHGACTTYQKGGRVCGALVEQTAERTLTKFRFRGREQLCA